MAKEHKYVYTFGAGKAEGDASMRNLLGGKGANLAEMCNIGLPVPAGFTITHRRLHLLLRQRPHLSQRAEKAGRGRAGARRNDHGGASSARPRIRCLVSCRSGARESMPGMMDTVLNIGLNEKTLEALAKQSQNERFAWDSYRRFVQMYGDVVLDMKPKDKRDMDPFEKILEEVKHKAKVKYDSELSVDQLKDVVAQFKKMVKDQTGKDFPTDPMEQVWGAIGAVFGSWMNDRAVVYRRQYGIPHEWGTATNVQAMVFGNLGNDCATGVGLTRDGALGLPGFNGDYLVNAQGEDVVAGIRTPKRIEIELPKEMPEAFQQLDNIGKTLERHYKDVQDIEFTIQRGKVWMLQTRNAKRTGFAAVRIAVDLVNEGLITEQEALQKRRIPADDLNQLLQPIFDPEAKKKASAAGQAARQGNRRRSGRGHGKDLFPCLRRRGAAHEGPQGRADPRPSRNQPRRSARHANRQGHPHRVRRSQLARGPRQPADGQGLHRRLRRAQHRLSQRNAHRRRQDAQAGRLDQHRRFFRRGL